MENNTIQWILNNLEELPTHYEFKGIQIHNKLAYIAVDKEGYIALVVNTLDIGNYLFSTDNIKLTLGINCKVSTNESVFEGNCHILSCKSKDKNLQKMFMILSFALVYEMNETRNSDELVSFFHSLQQLFKTTPSINLQKEQQGLWGELFLIKQYYEITNLHFYWHKDPYIKFDFSSAKYKLEVKTTSREERIHPFSHNQLFREDNTEIMIASYILQHDDAGLSLRSLIDYLRQIYINNPQFLMKLEKSVIKAGMLDKNSIGPIFDENLALTNLSFYIASNIPKFNQPEPSGVTGTRYNVDLSTVDKMNEAELLEWLLKWD